MTKVLAGPTTCETDEQSLWSGRPIDTALESKLRTLFQCIDRSNPAEYKLIDATACNWFVGKSLQTAWGFSDFKKGDGYFTANELADGLASGQFSHWREIGTGDQQEANDTAAIRTKAGNPVIAAWRASGPTGHVACSFDVIIGVHLPLNDSIQCGYPHKHLIGLPMTGLELLTEHIAATTGLQMGVLRDDEN
jgi:hypothetical protein